MIDTLTEENKIKVNVKNLNIEICLNQMQVLQCFHHQDSDERNKYNFFLLTSFFSGRGLYVEPVLQNVKLIVLKNHEFEKHRLELLITLLAFLPRCKVKH